MRSKKGKKLHNRTKERDDSDRKQGIQWTRHDGGEEKDRPSLRLTCWKNDAAADQLNIGLLPILLPVFFPLLPSTPPV